MNYEIKLKRYIETEIEVLKNLDVNEISTVMNVLEDCRNTGGHIYICGNGGSAATASHFVCDFNKGISGNLEKKYKFVCLNDNVPLMMAVANDIGYEDIFRYPLQGILEENDCVIGISGSGNSLNVLNAIIYAKNCNAKTIAIVGYDGGNLKKEADYAIHVNIENMQISEDIHMILDHAMMYILAGCDGL